MRPHAARTERFSFVMKLWGRRSVAVPPGFLFFFPRSLAVAEALLFGAIEGKVDRTKGGRAERSKKSEGAQGKTEGKPRAKKARGE